MAHGTGTQVETVRISRVVMYLIALTLVLCTVMVVVFKGIDAMPYDYVGVVGAVILTVVALGFTRVH